MNRKYKTIAVGVSGSGTTFEAIAKAIKSNKLKLTIAIVFADRDCRAIVKAKDLGIKVVVRKNDENIEDFHQRIITEIHKLNIDIVALAGYLRRFPVTENDSFIVINSHPGAIPYFGGQGMYGSYVHEAVYTWLQDTDWAHPYTYSTVHIATRVYDKGPKLGIVGMRVENGDNPDTISARLLPLEHTNYIQVLADLSEDKIEPKEYPDNFKQVMSK